MSKVLRLFFAIQFETKLRENLVRLIAKLRREPWAHQVRWTQPENLHLTLRYLGDCQLIAVPSMLQTVSDALAGVKPFTLQLQPVRLFPSLEKPYVIVIGVVASDALCQLVKILEGSVATVGFKAVKSIFMPHITLGRVTQKPIVITPEKYQLEMTSFSVKEIVLLESEKVAYGRAYQLVQRIELAGFSEL